MSEMNFVTREFAKWLKKADKRFASKQIALLADEIRTVTRRSMDDLADYAFQLAVAGMMDINFVQVAEYMLDTSVKQETAQTPTTITYKDTTIAISDQIAKEYIEEAK